MQLRSLPIASGSGGSIADDAAVRQTRVIFVREVAALVGARPPDRPINQTSPAM
jgi:hypothetical protein